MKTGKTDSTPQLPTTEQIRLAMEIYLRHAYPGGAPQRTAHFLPACKSATADWLKAAIPESELETIRNDQSVITGLALRVGNEQYPNMKVRISLPPHGREYLFCVDSHDVFLHAPRGSADYEALEQMKAFNASVAQAIVHDWSAAGLPTELNYMRQKIDEAKGRNTKTP